MTDTPDGSNPGTVPGAELEREVAGYYEAYAVQLLRYAETHTRDLDLGKDAVQEVFLRYFAERRFGNRIENPRAWLYRVLHNHLLDRLSRAAMKCEVSADGTERMADLQAGAEMRMEQRQTAREIEARLTPRELACLRLRVEGLSYQEIADRLGVRIGTVGALLPRVYTKLREGVNEGAFFTESTAGALFFLLGRGQPYAS